MACSWSCAFWTATASCPASAARSAVSFSPATGPTIGVGREQPDHVAAGDQRNGQRRADPGLPSNVRDHREAWIAHDVCDLEHRSLAQGAEGEVEQTVGDPCVRACEPTARRFFEHRLAFTAEVHGDPLHAEQLANALDRRLERVRDGQLGGRLGDHLEQCASSLELQRQ